MDSESPNEYDPTETPNEADHLPPTRLCVRQNHVSVRDDQDIMCDPVSDYAYNQEWKDNLNQYPLDHHLELQV